jgi:hypothetical protein
MDPKKTAGHKQPAAPKPTSSDEAPSQAKPAAGQNEQSSEKSPIAPSKLRGVAPY